MNRVIIIVFGGVADVYNDPDTKVLFIDTDNLDEDNSLLTKEEIEGFEDLIPKFIMDDYVEKSLINKSILV